MSLSQAEREEIWKLANDPDGPSYNEISDRFDCSNSTVSRWAQKNRDEVFPDDEEPSDQETQDTQDDTPDEEPDQESDTDDQEPDTDDQEPDTDSQDGQGGVQVDEVVPDEKDTRKHQETTDDTQGSEGETWKEIDPNDKNQVKLILETTDIDDPRKSQKLLWSFVTGNNKMDTEFEEIRMSDAELR